MPENYLPHVEELQAEANDLVRKTVARPVYPALFVSGGKGLTAVITVIKKVFRPTRIPLPWHTLFSMMQ